MLNFKNIIQKFKTHTPPVLTGIFLGSTITLVMLAAKGAKMLRQNNKIHTKTSNDLAKAEAEFKELEEKLEKLLSENISSKWTKK